MYRTCPIVQWYLNEVFVSAIGVDGIADHYSGIDSLVYSGKHSVTVTQLPNIRFSTVPGSRVEDLYRFKGTVA